MCGIVGVIAKEKSGLYKQQLDVFMQMLFVDQLRGMDGTGVFYDDKDGKTVILKSPKPASNLMVEKEFREGMEDAVRNGHFLIGHNRAATKGEHSWENTHPFKEENITLVHNGTLLNHDNLDSSVKVDSHAICKYMAVNGCEKTLEEVDGAFALIWYNEKEKILQLARNKERPLHLIETSTCWLISSELGLGTWIAQRGNMHIIRSFELAVQKIYTFKLGSLRYFEEKEVKYKTTGFFGNSIPFHKERYNNSGKSGGVYSHPHIRAKTAHQPVPVIQKTNVLFSKVKSFGTRLQFSPVYIKEESKESCLVWDEKRDSFFLLGKVPDNLESDVEVRVYNDYTDLVKLIYHSCLEGTVVSTVIRGNKILYSLSNIIKKETKPINLRSVEGTCEFCTVDVPEGEKNHYNGMVLCPACYSTFVDNPELAQEMGYCQ